MKQYYKFILILFILSLHYGESFGQFNSYQLSWDVAPSPIDFKTGRYGALQIWRNGNGQLYHPFYSPTSFDMYNGLFMLDGNYLIVSYSYELDGYDSYWRNGSVTDVSGSGTAVDPWQITAYLESRWSSHEIEVTYSYVNGADWIDVAMTPTVANNNNDVIKVFHILDTYLGGTDEGPAYTSGTAPYDVVGVADAAGAVYESFVVGNTPWDRYCSNYYDTALNEPYHDGQLSNTLDFDPTNDNAIGVQWTLGVVQGTQPTITYRIGFTDEELVSTSCGLIIMNKHVGFKTTN